jgi:hypothetical protein
MASLLDMAQARLQGLLDLPARAGRALVDPTVFSGLLGAPTLPKERGIAQAAYGLPPEPNMSVLNPEQAAYMQGYAQGEPLSYLGLLAPFTAPATVAGAKAVAPQAGMALENYMARQGLIQPLTAYHGTPHTIQGQFDINKVGTGEGAQAYGYGMYFAENPAVAKEYSKMSPAGGAQPSPRRAIGGTEVEPMTPEYKAAQLVDEMGLAKAKKFVADWSKNPTPEQVDFVQGIQNTLSGITKKSDVKNLGTGNLYKVDIPDADIPFMLDWNKSLTKQTPEVQTILKDKFPSAFDDPRQSTGQGLYKELVKGMAKVGAKDPEKFMSEILNQYGIKGIRYLDEGSRKAGGTSNFVVFEPSTVNILEKNSEKVEGLLD